VTCNALPAHSPLHREVHAYAEKISKLLMPKTQSYYEIWLDGEEFHNRESEKDPLYQDRYLPRKFKIGIAIPPNNDVDVFTNDIGLTAIIENEKLLGFNIAIGGGLSLHMEMKLPIQDWLPIFVIQIQKRKLKSNL
jgi:sulfite reductase (NADPH) hemoprotein beta-component